MGWKRKEPEGLEDTDHELGASARPDLALWVCLQPPAAWRVQQHFGAPVRPTCTARGRSQKRGTGCRRGGGTGMACSRRDMAHSGSVG